MARYPATLRDLVCRGSFALVAEHSGARYFCGALRRRDLIETVRDRVNKKHPALLLRIHDSPDDTRIDGSVDELVAAMSDCGCLYGARFATRSEA